VGGTKTQPRGSSGGEYDDQGLHSSSYAYSQMPELLENPAAWWPNSCVSLTGDLGESVLLNIYQCLLTDLPNFSREARNTKKIT
jgi:hypothetical protein